MEVDNFAKFCMKPGPLVFETHIKYVSYITVIDQIKIPNNNTRFEDRFCIINLVSLV